MGKYGYNGPEQFRPLSPWAYVGYAILFSIPIVGFICLIVFSCSNTNINRRSFARAYWIPLLIAVILAAVTIGGGGLAYMSYYFR